MQNVRINSGFLGEINTMQRYVSKIVFTLLLASVFMVLPASASTVAGDVTDKETLKSFVMNAKDHLKSTSTASGLFATLRDFRDNKAWKDGSIYLFIMQRPSGPQGGEIVAFNAHNSNLEGTTLHVMDEDGKDVGHEIDKAVYQGDGFVKYKWDNPAVSGDEMSEKGKTPGTSRKIVYGVNVKLFGEDFVLGSGFYPDPPPASSDKKGCAIATTETGNSSQSAIFNLLLIVSGMFLLVSWKNRLEEK